MSMRMMLAIAVVMQATVVVASAGELKGTVTIAGSRDNADAVVYLDAIPDKTFPAPSEPSRIDQKNMEFVPHVLPVLVGTTVEFLNSDAVLHNVFTPDKCAERFNLGSWPRGQVRTYTFKQPCIATLLCNVHPEMEAFAVVLPTPYFAVTEGSGTYAIDNIPDGDYTVKVWHPKREGSTEKITISGATVMDFELSRK